MRSDFDVAIAKCVECEVAPHVPGDYLCRTCRHIFEGGDTCDNCRLPRPTEEDEGDLLTMFRTDNPYVYRGLCLACNDLIRSTRNGQCENEEAEETEQWGIGGYYAEGLWTPLPGDWSG